MYDKTTIVLTVLILYKIGLIAIGLWAQRRNNNIQDFLIGNRQLGPLVAAVSYAASSSSAWTLLGMSGIAFTMGLSAVWFVVGAILGMLLSWTFIAPKLMRMSHQHHLTTLTDVLLFRLEKSRWYTAITIFASLVIIIAFGFYVAAQLQGAGQTFHHTFAIEQNKSIVIGAAIVLIYTLLGGFWAVSVTDTIQGLLMLLAAILLPIAAYIQMGGWDAFCLSYTSIATPSQLSWVNHRPGLAAVGFVVAIIGICLGAFGQPHLLVRFMAIRDSKALVQARIIAVTWFTIVFGGMFFLGLAGRVIVGDFSDAESIFITLTDQLFTPVIAGVIIAALLSAIMSTADSQLLAGAAAISHDLGIGQYFAGHEILVSRIAITIMLVISTVIALTIPATIFSRALLSWSALGAAFGPIIIFRVMRLRPSARAVFLSMTSGFVLATWFHFNPNSLAPLFDSTIVSGAIFERVASFMIGISILLFSCRKQS